MRHRLVLFVVVGMLLAGCSKSSTSSGNSPGASSAPPSPTPTAQALTLESMPTGTATLTWDPKTELISATLDMYGFTPNSAHAMHIHSGSCLKQVNPPVIPFPDVTATATGVVSETVQSAKVPGGIPASGYLNIHLAPGAALGSPGSTSFTPIACADLGTTGTATGGTGVTGTSGASGTATGTTGTATATATPTGTATPTSTASSKTGPITLTMLPLPQAGQHPVGTVSDSYDASAHTLTVNLSVTGLPTGTAHAAHIHAGSCAAQGPVVHMLSDLMADGTGNASGSSTVTGVTTTPPSTGWYVNVHMGSGSTILDANGKPTLVFQPILCADLKG